MRAEPGLETLGGTAPARVLRRYWLSMRPAFFPASIMPVVVGTAWGQAVAGELDPAPAVLALLATALVHGGANVLNDVGDELGGTDRANEQRIYPYTGGSRFIQNGVLSLAQMRRWGVALIAIAVVLGAILARLAGPGVIAMGLAGVLLAVAYSLPPLRLQARGVGEIVIAIAFGVLPVMGSAWLQGARLDLGAFLVSLPTAMWITSLLLINEVPDIAADATAGKRTIPVRFGLGGTRVVYFGLALLALLASVAMVAHGLVHWGVLAGSLVLFALGIRATRGIGAPDGPSRPRLRASIEATIAIHAFGSAWIAGWVWFAPKPG